MSRIRKDVIRKIRCRVLICTLVALVISFFGMAFSIKQEIGELEYQAERQGNILKYSVDSMLLNLNTLSAMVINGNGDLEHFYDISENLMNNSVSSDAIKSLQVAPNGVVTNICPEEGNEAGKIDLFADPDRKTEAEWARDTGNTTLAGPYELLQGGFAMVARKPVYLTGKDGKDTFWGFVIEVLDMEATLKPAHLESFVKDGYDYCFWRKDPKTGEKSIICQSTETEYRYPISIDIDMPNVTWHFDVTPKGGWISAKDILPLLIFVLAVMVLSAGGFYHYYIRAEKKISEKKNLLLKKSLNNIANNVVVFRYQNEKLDPVIANKQFLNFMKLAEDDFKLMDVDAFLNSIGCSFCDDRKRNIDLSGIHDRDFESQILRPGEVNKRWFFVNCRTITDEDDSTLLYVTMTDIDEEKKKEKQLQTTQKELENQIESGREWEYHAEHDALTGLLNRKAYERIVSELNQKKIPIGFILVDIDNFKEINDDYGHTIGDRLLKKGADILSQHVRGSDYAFRLGGDEFVVILCNVQSENAEYIANRIRRMSEQLATKKDDLPVATFSAGVYFSINGIDETVYKHADEALYHTKNNGRAGYTIFDENLNIILEKHESSSLYMSKTKTELLDDNQTGTWRIEMPVNRHALLYYDDTMCDLLGLERNDTPEQAYDKWMQNVDSAYKKTIEETVQLVLETGAAEVTYPYHHPKYGIMDVRCTATCDKDYSNGCCIYGFHHNITNTASVTKVDEMRERDVITEELNTRGFLRKTEDMLRENNGEYAMLHFDVNGFKAINDQIGYERGNLILREIANAIRNSELKPDIITRDMADHFYCLLNKERVDYKEISWLCKQRISVDNTVITVFMQCGIYFIDDLNMSVRNMCDKARLAEAAVLESDASTPYFVFTDEMQQDYLRRKEIVASLDEAITEHEFKTFFQPIYDAQTGKVVSAEALIRWIKPDGQIVAPDQFIPIFEKNGQISRIDLLVNRSVQHCLMERSKEGKTIVPISVNLSRIDFYNEDVMEQLVQSAKEFGLSKQYLRFEITESAYTEIPAQSAKMLTVLHDYGAKILIDDFGKGYSSLSSLTEHQFDIVKLDMSFIRKIGKNIRAEAIIRASIEMAHMMNAAVVAEGVETKEQYEFLKDKGCDYIQGYYFSKPLPQEQFEALLDKN